MDGVAKHWPLANLPVNIQKMTAAETVPAVRDRTSISLIIYISRHHCLAGLGSVTTFHGVEVSIVVSGSQIGGFAVIVTRCFCKCKVKLASWNIP